MYEEILAELAEFPASWKFYRRNFGTSSARINILFKIYITLICILIFIKLQVISKCLPNLIEFLVFYYNLIIFSGEI